MEPKFVRKKISELKKYLRGISVANKLREELLDLCIKADELAIEIIDEPGDQMGVSAKLETEDGTVPDPYSLKSDWTTDLSSFPNYTWGDMYAYLIVKEGYDHESLKAFKSLKGFRLHWDGHVQSLQANKSIFCGCHLIKFGMKPTEREKTHIDNKPTYKGKWFCSFCPLPLYRRVNTCLYEQEKTFEKMLFYIRHFKAQTFSPVFRESYF